MTLEEFIKARERIRDIATEWRKIADSDQKFRQEHSDIETRYVSDRSEIRADCWENALAFLDGKIEIP